jgi:hypothetical protein
MSKEIPKNQLKLELFDDSPNKELKKDEVPSLDRVDIDPASDSVDDKNDGLNERTLEEEPTREYNLPEKPDYHMGYWVEKQQKKDMAREKGGAKKGSKENKVRQEIPQEIWDQLNSIGRIIQNEIMFLSGTEDVYKAGSHSWIKESAQRLRNNNNREGANELLRLRGALTRARYCRKLLNEGDLDGFIEYIKKLPKAKGVSCGIILNLDHYDRLVEIIKNIK